jgi:2-dehydro-3-deoxy-D-arabinonate dehydratase
LLCEVQEGSLSSLTSLNEEVSDFRDLLKASNVSGMSVDDITRHILASGRGVEFDLTEMIEWSKVGGGDAQLIAPLEPDEMWAGGIGNYPVPPERVDQMPEATRIAYESDRPPLMYKGTASRLAGPFDDIGIRSDTEKTVPEGELVLVIYKRRLVAYSTGNEMAGGLMGETLWWMVPSKVFKGCASLGPCVVTPEGLPDPANLKMELIITRDGREVAKVNNVTALRRPIDELVRWSAAHDTPPDLVILYTGGCVAAGDSPVQDGDVVRISLEGVGHVENKVISV